MKLEQQVVSLELAKKLKELGVPRESYFYWVNQYDRKLGWTGFIIQKSCNKALLCDKGDELFGEPIIYSAFTVAELGILLPEDFFLSLGRTLSGGWCLQLDEVEQTMLYADIEADIRAKMLIYLLENNLLQANQD